MSLTSRLWGALTVLAGRSIENPSVPLSQVDMDTFGEGGQTASGVPVNQTRALTDAAWFRGIDLLSKTIAKLPCNVYARTAEGKERDPGHPAYQLLRYKPNADWTAFLFWQTRIAQALDTGGSYAIIERDGQNRPIGLIPTDPDSTFPVRVDGRLSYSVQVKKTGEAFNWPARNILHIRGFGFDGLDGVSVRQAARDEIGLGIATRDYGGRFFRNGAGQRVLLQHPARMSEEAQANFLKGWERMTAGVNNANRTAILEEGMKAMVIGVTARDSQMVEGRELHVREIANFLGLPPHKLGDTSTKTFASLEQENQSFLNDSIDPWLVNIEQECRDKMLSAREKAEDSHVVEFNRNAVVKADIAARFKAYGEGLAGMPFMTLNEVRASENLNGVPGGDVIQVPINMQQPGVGEDMPADTDTGPDRSALRAATEAAVESARHRATRHLGVKCRKAARDRKQFGDWLDGMESDHGAVVSEILSPAVRCHAAAHGSDTLDELQRFSGEVIGAVREAADQAYTEARGSEFVAAIDAAMTDLESTR